MTEPIEVASLPPAARRLLDAKTPAQLRIMAARGIAPGLKPGDAIAVIALLADDADTSVADVAATTIQKLPTPLLNGALGTDIYPWVIDRIAPYYAHDAQVMERILAQPQIDPATVSAIAALGNEAVCELIATNEERLLLHPMIIEKLYMNRSARMSTADRVLELAVRNGIELSGIPAFQEAAAAIANELIPEASPEPTIDDELFVKTGVVAAQVELDPRIEDTHELDQQTGEELVQPKFLPLHAMLAQMTISQKIRRAMLGTPAERLLLVRDSNRLVAAAVVKSPMIQENEVVRISLSRNVSQDVLRIIARDQNWLKSHVIKFNLVSNPRTPFAFASKLILHLREHELKSLAKSKNVTGAVSTAAKQQLMRREKK